MTSAFRLHTNAREQFFRISERVFADLQVMLEATA